MAVLAATGLLAPGLGGAPPQDAPAPRTAAPNVGGDLDLAAPQEPRLVAVPPDVAEDALAAGVREVTVVAAPPPGSDRDGYRLWRLSITEGILAPGPAVPPVVAMARDPGRGRDRLVLLTPDEAVLVVDGFTDARPEEVWRSADAVGFGEDGVLVLAGLDVRLHPRRSVASATHLRVEEGEAAVRRRRKVVAPGMEGQGVFVSEGRVYLTGQVRGRSVTVELGPRGASRIRELDGYRVIDVGPSGVFVLLPDDDRARVPLVSTPRRGIRTAPTAPWPTFHLDLMAGWSPDGRFLAAVGYPAERPGHLGLWLLPLDGSRPVLLRAEGDGDRGRTSAVAFAPGGVVWTDRAAIYVRRFAPPSVTRRMPLPEGLPELTSPVAVR